LETAIGLDPVNEELYYQRLMRIHGRNRHPRPGTRTLQRLEDQLAQLGTEPSVCEPAAGRTANCTPRRFGARA